MQAYFLYDSYRKLLKDFTLSKKELYGTSFSFAAMAKVLKIQRTYLSAVLNDRGHLNSDQIFSATEFLGLNEEERNFLNVLHQFETSTHKKRKNLLQAELTKTRGRKLDTSEFVAPAHTLESSNLGSAEFYLNVDAQLVHMFLTIEFYRKEPSKIRSILHLSASGFSHAMQIVERAGLIELEGTQVKVLKDDFHMSKDDFVYPYYRLLMRQKSLRKLQDDISNEQFSFSVLFSSDEKTRDLIHKNFLDFIESCKKLTDSGDINSVYQINFDLLNWAR